MAKKDTRKNEETTVTRVKAADTREVTAKKTTKKTTPVKTAAVANEPNTSKNPLKAFGGYFVGAWQELRQVRWPNRKATWSLTGAMLVYTAFFVALILLLDALFKYVFQLILG